MSVYTQHIEFSVREWHRELCEFSNENVLVGSDSYINLTLICAVTVIQTVLEDI